MVSIKDVAKLAGVSASTVSLVLNGSDKVKHETAYRVRQAVEELHYFKPGPVGPMWAQGGWPQALGQLPGSRHGLPPLP